MTFNKDNLHQSLHLSNQQYKARVVQSLNSINLVSKHREYFNYRLSRWPK